MKKITNTTPNQASNTYRIVLACIALVSMVMGLFIDLSGDSVTWVSAQSDIIPSVTLNVLGEAFIGTNVTFEVVFNNPATAEGYGPIVDLIIPTNGADGMQNTGTLPPGDPGFPDEQLDGLTFLNATYLGVQLERTVLTFPGEDDVTCVDHPYFVDETNTPVIVCGDAGDTFVSLRLPFGSFTPDQPPLSIQVTTSMSPYADLGVPLTIQARGGYQFGEDPLNNPATDNPAETISDWERADVIPTLFTLSKSYIGPEDETATGPNFPRRYTITATIAPDQVMTNFFLEDQLPDNMQFVELINTSPTAINCSEPSTTIPGGDLRCNFGTVSGTVSMTFEFFIPLRDAIGASVIDPISGESVISCNNALGGGDWVPLDPRDVDDSGTFILDPDGCEHELNDRSIAIQKSVEIVGGGTLRPGRTLEYTLDIQVSDFFAFDDVLVEDSFCDGQKYNVDFTPRLEVDGNQFGLALAAFDPENFDISCNYTGMPDAPSPQCTINDPAPIDGRTTLIFRVSDEIGDRRTDGDGRLVGGCVPTDGTQGPDPNCANYNNGPTTARIVFQTIVGNEFTDLDPDDPGIVQGDQLCNRVELITGAVLSTDDATTPTNGNPEDDSGVLLDIGRGDVAKSIYAINGDTTFEANPLVEIKPGDEVTYQVIYDMPLGDVKDLMFIDYFPLPIMRVNDPDADKILGPDWTFDTTVSAAVPPPGVVKFGEDDTFYDYTVLVDPNNDGLGVIPELRIDTPNNALEIDYGNFWQGLEPGNYVIDLLFTITVTDDPFADRLQLTNQIRVIEGSTAWGTFIDDALVQFILTQPVVNIQKGVVWTDNAAGQFDPAPPAPVTFLAPSQAPRWSGIINSTLLSTNPINSNLSGVDAGDRVTFAIVLENTGTSGNGAFDVEVREEAVPEGFVTPGDGLNLQVFNGDRSAIGFTDLGGGLFGDGIRLNNDNGLGSLGNFDSTSGANLAIITYDLILANDVAPGQTITNTAFLDRFAGAPGADNHLDTPRQDDAQVQIAEPQIVKVLDATNQAHTENEDVAIGEILTYEVVVTIPEGISSNVTLTDTLNLGLAFVRCVDIVADTGLSTDLDGGFTSACPDPPQASPGVNPTVSPDGGTITWDLGTITNADRDNTEDETLTITYEVVVLNTSGNTRGQQRNNAAVWRWEWTENGDVQSDTITDSAENVTIVEPTLQTTKTADPIIGEAGDTITYTIVVSHSVASDADAFDLVLTDIIPDGMNYVADSFECVATTYCTAVVLDDNAAPILEVTWETLPDGSTTTLTYEVVIDISVNPGQVLTNDVVLTWTSLPGDVTTPQSVYSDVSTERTGDEDDPGTPNNYITETDDDVTILITDHEKFLAATSEAHTDTERVAIGEIIRYRLVVNLPQATSPNFQVRDNLPAGLLFLNDNTAKAAFVSNGGILSQPFDSIPGVTDANCQITGNDPTAAIPGACPALADFNVGSTNSTTVNVDDYNSGTDVWFKLGTLVNDDDDGDNEYVIIEFNALVLNLDGANAANAAGDSRINNFNVYIDGSQIGNTSTSVTVTVVEPALTLDKTAAIEPSADAGDTVTYTLVVTAAGDGDNRATAFDLVITDTLDAFLEPGTVSLVAGGTTQPATCIGDGAGTSAFGTNDLTDPGEVWDGNELTITATCLDPGRTLTFEVTATVRDNVPAGYEIENEAELTWTSLPDDRGTLANPTGSETPGDSGDPDGERDGSGGANNYLDDSQAPLNITEPIIVKGAPNPTDYAIGETVTYPLTITLPEGITRNLRVVDIVPAGMAYVTSSLDVSDFAGTFTNDPPSIDCGGCVSGDDVTFTFGDVTTDVVPGNNSFVIEITLQVLNEAGNQNTITLTNRADLIYWPGTEDVDDAVDGGAQIITVIEPELVIIKEVNDDQPLVGQELTYTLTVSHLPSSTADAYDLVLEDVLPAGLKLEGVLSASTSCGVGLNTLSTANNTVTAILDVLPLNCVLTITYQAEVLAGDFQDVLTNNAGITWTSMPGDVEPEQRTGTGEPPFNDYFDDTDQDVTLQISEIELLKTADPQNYNAPGQTITYTFSAENTGTVDLFDVQITDPLVGLSALVCEIDGVPVGQPVAVLPVGETLICTATYTITQADIDAGSVVNNASVTATDKAGDTVTDEDDETVNADQNASIELTKTADPLTYNQVGQTITYAFTVENTGNVTLTEVTITDPLVTVAGGPIGSLAPGVVDSTTFTATYIITQADLDRGFVLNEATVTGNYTDADDVPQTVEDDDDATVTADQDGRIELTKTADPLVYTAAGQTITYAFTVVNPGNVTLYNVTITDPLVTVLGGPIAELAPGAVDSTTFTATYTITQADMNAGSVFNEATVTGEYTDADDVAQTATDDDDATVTADQDARIELTKVATPEIYDEVGNVISYQLVARNTGNVTLNDVTISDPLLPVLTCTPGQPTTLDPGEELVCEGSYTVDQDDLDRGFIDNTARVDATDPDDGEVSDTADETVDAGQAPVLRLEKAATEINGGEPSPFTYSEVDDEITYTYTLTNVGNVTLFGPFSVDDDVIGSFECDGADVELAPLDSVDCTATYDITQADLDAGFVYNVATATGNYTDAEGDPQTVTSEPDDETVLADQQPAIDLIKTAEQVTFNVVGDVIDYTFTVTNTGNVTLYNVTIADPLVTVDGGPIAELAPEAVDETTFTATYTITQADLDRGFVLNVATATGEYTDADDVTRTVTDDDDASVRGVQQPGIDLIKTAVTVEDDQGNLRDEVEFHAVGDVITYTFTVTNTGNVTLFNVLLIDPKVTVQGGPIAELAPGAVDSTTFTATYTITQADLDRGNLDNIAVVVGSFTDGDNVTQSVTDRDDENVPGVQAPAIELTKTADPSTYDAAGETITYSFRVENTGNVTLTGVRVTDPLFGLTFGPITLAPDGIETFEYIYTITQDDMDAGQIENAASVTGNDPNGDPVTDEDDETITANQAPAISLTKTAILIDGGTPDPFVITQAGQTITYSFTVVNIGNVTLTNVVIDDVILVIVDLPVNPSTLAPFEVGTVTVTYTVTQADVDAGSVVNTATATGTPPIGVDVDDTDTETVDAAQDPDINLTKTATLINGEVPEPFTITMAGDVITYTFTAENTGNVTLTDVTISDVMIDADDPICDPVDLAPGETRVCTATYMVTQDDMDTGEVENLATVRAEDPNDDPVVDDDDETVEADQDPSIAVVKTAVLINGLDETELDPFQYSAVDDVITFQITLTNDGNVTVYNPVLIDDDVTDGPTYVSGDTNGDGVLDVGETWVFTATYTVTQEDLDRGFFENLASGSGSADTTGDGQGDTPVNDEDDETVDAEQRPELTVTKTATRINGLEPDPFEYDSVGDVITYLIEVVNTGNVTLTNITVTDPLTGLDGSIGILVPGASQTFTETYTITQDDLDAGEFVNTAAAAGYAPGDDPNEEPTVEDSDDETVDADQNPAIALIKTVEHVRNEGGDLQYVDGRYRVVGDVITYSFTVTNTGNVTLFNVTISDPQVGPVSGSIPELAPGASDSTTFSVAYSVTQTDIDTGSVLNVATVNATDPNDDPVSDDDTATVFGPDADASISLIKTGTYVDVNEDDIFNLGDRIDYTFTVENTGNVTLFNVTISDPMIDDANPICDPVDLAPEETHTCIASYMLTQDDIDAGRVVNVATAGGYELGDDQQDPPTVTDDDEETIILEQNPEIDLNKTVDAQEAVSSRDMLVYTITATNTGNVTLFDVVISDPMFAADDLICDPEQSAELEPGQSLTCTVEYVVTAADAQAGFVYNEAVVTAEDPDGTPIDADDDEQVDVLPLPDLTVEKTNNAGEPLYVGDTFTWTIVVSNVDARAEFAQGNIVMRDPLPEGANYGNVIGPDPAIDGLLCEIVENPNLILRCRALVGGVTLEPDQSFTVTVDVTPTQAGVLNNTAIVDPGQNVDESNEENNRSTDSVTVEEIPLVPDLTVVKTNDLTGPLYVGDTFTWTIEVINRFAPAEFPPNTNIMRDILPEGATYGAVTGPDPAVEGVVCEIVDNDGPRLRCRTQADSVTLDADTSFTVTVEVTPTEVGELVNTAVVDPRSVVEESDETNNEDTDSVTVEDIPLVPDLTVVKTNDLTGPLYVGDTFTWTIEVINRFAPAEFPPNTNIMRDILPEGATYGAVTGPDPAVEGVVCEIVDNDGPRLRCRTQAESVTLGADTSFTVTVEVTPTDVGELVNTAVVDPRSAVEESDETNNEDTDSVTVEDIPSLPDLTVVKTNDAPDPLFVGETFTWTIVVSNADAPAVFAEGNGVVRDPLPVGATYELLSGPVPEVENLNCWINDNVVLRCVAGAGGVVLAADSAFTIEISVTPTIAGELENFVRVDVGNNVEESDETNNTDTDTVTVLDRIPPVLTLEKTGFPNTFDSLGETITYTYVLTNNSTETIFPPYSVTDDKVSVSCPDEPAQLGFEESVTCLASYEITQADLDAGFVTNIAVASARDIVGNDVNSNQDSETVLSEAAPSLRLVKNAVEKEFEAVGDTINYQYFLINDSNVTLAGPFSVVDDKIDTVTCPQPDSLAPGAFIICEGSYEVTGADLDAGFVTNVASGQAFFNDEPVASEPDQETVQAEGVDLPSLLLIKNAMDSRFVEVGNELTYNYFVINNGNVTLSGPFTVTDDKANNVTCPQPDSLAPGAFIICTATYTVTEDDVTAGFVTNLAFAQGFYEQEPITSNTDEATVRACVDCTVAELMIIKLAQQSVFSDIGDVIDYNYLVINTGNVSLDGPFTVDDDKIDTITCPDTVSLDPGEMITCTGSYTITENDMAVGLVTNTAAAMGFYQGAPIVSVPDTVTVPRFLAPNPSLSLIKLAAEDQFAEVGDLIQYTYLVINDGNVILDGPITISDDKIPAVNITCPPVIAFAPADFILCTASYEVTANDIASGTVTNIAFAAASYNGQDVVSDTDTVSVTGINLAQPSLLIVKHADQYGFDQTGDVLTYTYLVVNNGNVTLNGPITVDDDNISNVTCPDTISLEPGEAITCEASYNVISADLTAGQVTNNASAQAFYDNETVQSNTDTVTVNSSAVPEEVSLLLVKTALDPTFSDSGDIINYQYLLINTGNVTLDGPFSVDDDLIDTVSCPDIVSLAPNASIICTASYTIALDDVTEGSVTNIATAQAFFNGNEVQSNQDSETITDTLLPDPELMIIKNSVETGYAQVGDEINYTYRVINTGNVVLDGPITITDDQIDNVSCPVTASLDPGEFIICQATHTVTVQDLTNGSITNEAFATAEYDGSEVDSEEDSVTVDALITPNPTLIIVKTVDQNTYSQVGDTLNYTFLVINSGNVTLTGPFSVDDDRATDEFCPAVDSLAPGESITCTASYMITQQDIETGLVTNIAAATGFYHGTEVTSPPDSATATSRVVSQPALQLIKSADKLFFSVAGETINYSYFLINTGNVTLTSPFSVEDDKIDTVSCPDTDSLAPGELIICSASYTVLQDDVEAGSITNIGYGQAFYNDTQVDTPSVSVTVTTGIPDDPSLMILKLADQDSFANVGDELTYKYYVINNGNVPITGPITVTDDRIDNVICPDTAVLNPASVIMCTGSYLVIEADLLAGSVTNLAWAQGSFEGEVIETAPVSETVPSEIELRPALQIIKRADQNFFVAEGDILTYEYLVINTGNVILTGPFTVIDDKIDAVDCPDTDSLAPGEYLECTASYEITQADMALGFVTNIATAQGFYLDDPVVSPPDSETVSTTTDVDPSLLIVKYALNSSFSKVGDVLNYGYLVINNGNVTINGPITVSDDKIDVVNCPVVAALEPGESLTCTAVYVVTEADMTAGQVTNVATAHGFVDGNPISSDPDSETVPFVPGPSKSITKTVTSSGPYTAGDTITYSIVVQNTGPDTLTGVMVVDLMPGVVIEGCDPPMPATLASMESMICTARYVLTEGDITAGSITNTAFAFSDQADPVSDSETVDLLEDAVPAITIVKAVSVDSGATWQRADAAPGPSATSVVTPQFRFTVTNTGNVTLGGITLTDSHIDQFYAADLVTPCSIPATLDPSQSFMCYSAMPWQAGQHVNTATVVGIYEGIPYADSNRAHYFGLTQVFQPPTGTKTISAVELPDLEFRMVWINNRNTDTILTRVIDDIPAGTTYKAGSLVCDARGTSVTAVCAFDTTNNRVVWEGTIGQDFGATNEANANNEIVITFRVVVADTTNVVTNQASSITDIDGDGSLEDDEEDPNSIVLTNEVAWERPIRVVDLEISKSVNRSQARIGDTVTYTLQVTNKGNETATQVVVTDPVSSFLDIQSVTTTKGTGTFSGRTATFNIGSLAPNETVTMTIRTRVNNTATATVDTPNVATVSHLTHGVSTTRNSNVVNVRILGEKTLPDTGEGPISQAQEPWMVYILSFTTGLTLFAAGLVLCILSDRLAKTWAGKKKTRVLVQRVIGGAGIFLGGTILALFMVSVVMTQVVVQGTQPQLGHEPSGITTELLPSGERLVIVSDQDLDEELLPVYEPPVWLDIEAYASGLGDFQETLLDYSDDSAIRRILIPALGINQHVDFIPFDGRTWPLVGIREQVAWLGETSTPGLGSNTVLAGHVSLRNGSVGPFYQLDQLNPGDKIILLTEQNSYTYIYQDSLVVENTDMFVTDATAEPILTLITCTNWDANAYTYLQRLVVVAALESVEPFTVEGR